MQQITGQQVLRLAASPTRKRQGSSTSNESPRPCPFNRCDGSGYWEEPSEFSVGPIQHECECLSLHRAARMQDISRLNEMQRNINFGNILITSGTPKTKQMLAYAQEFVRNPVATMTFWGTCGNAKTMVLIAIVNECLIAGIDAVYTRLSDMANWLRQSFEHRVSTGEYDGSISAKINRLKEIRVLCIDEFDKCKDSEWLREVKTDILDKRHEDGIAGLCGTVIAMNTDPKTIEVWLSSRFHDGRNIVFENDDGDMRKEIKRVSAL